MIMDLLKQLAHCCSHENSLIVESVHPWLREVVRPRNVAFMREVRFVCNIGDCNLFVDYVFGLPMLGWARHSPLLCQRTTNIPRSDRPTDAEIEANNIEVLRKARPAKDPKVDIMAWAKTEVELNKGTAIGPYYSFAALPRGRKRLLNRFTILERHGGATEDSARNIDDCRAQGHNLESACSSTHRPADLDLMSSLGRTVAEYFPGLRIGGLPSDFKGAYRQVTSCPLQALDFVVTSWNPELACQVFLLAVSQLFGSGNAPLNFTRCPDFCCRAISCLLGIAAVHCVDDVLVLEIWDSAMSAFHGWRGFADLCGWDVPDSKPPPPASRFRALGAMLDFSFFPGSPMLICPAEDRIEGLMELLLSILQCRTLSPGLAGNLYGKLMFLAASTSVVAAGLFCGPFRAGSMSMAGVD